MNAIKATWKNGQIVPDKPVAWREGSRLVIHEESLEDIAFMTEEEQGDEPESIEKWIADLRTIPPLPMTPEQEAEMLRWRQKAKEINLEAVRRQMAEGIP
jgi:predicted DNA-binding antitoxin AbrB/MazE fold protein